MKQCLALSREPRRPVLAHAKLFMLLQGHKFSPAPSSISRLPHTRQDFIF